jgi:hypothetical protein
VLFITQTKDLDYKHFGALAEGIAAALRRQFAFESGSQRRIYRDGTRSVSLRCVKSFNRGTFAHLSGIFLRSDLPSRFWLPPSPQNFRRRTSIHRKTGLKWHKTIFLTLKMPSDSAVYKPFPKGLSSSPMSLMACGMVSKYPFSSVPHSTLPTQHEKMPYNTP